jgi:hypothetical protein
VTGEITMVIFLLFLLLLLSFVVRWEKRHDQDPPVLSILLLMVSLIPFALSLVLIFAGGALNIVLASFLLLASLLAIVASVTNRGLENLPFIISILFFWSLPLAAIASF